MSEGYEWREPNAITRRFGHGRDIHREEFEEEGEYPPEDASMATGLEAVTTHSTAGLSNSMSLATSGHGAAATPFKIYDEISNKLLPPEESEMMLEALMSRDDRSIIRTYVEAKPMEEVQEYGQVLQVGLTFIPGADEPQVARIELDDAIGENPDQMTALWRVNTAGSLLKQFVIDKNLLVIEKDCTGDIVERAQRRQYLENKPRLARNESAKKKESRAADQERALIQRGLKRDHVCNIDSSEVKLVKDLRAGTWDIESTLIEVDSSALTNLMVNFRRLNMVGGPQMEFTEMAVILEQIVEDARRLCLRSPILFRMSTRQRIKHSKDIRYGVNHYNMFRTFSTSEGIKETIKLSATYWDSLTKLAPRDRAGNKKTRQLNFIRTRYLQTLVLLSSFLCNRDLEQLEEFLETTYCLKADRNNLEMVILKVIPLVSINSKVFMQALIPTVDAYPLPGNSPSLEEVWDVFVRRILERGYLLPGTIKDLGRAQKSWIVKWPEGGLSSSDVFNHLQFSGSRNRAINEIPPFEFHPEEAMSEITVIMMNEHRYRVETTDLEKITCMMPGIYSVWEAGDHGQRLDLEITEYNVNADIFKCVTLANTFIQKANNRLTMVRRTGTIKKMFSRRNMEMGFLDELKPTGRLSRVEAMLNRDRLAVVYKAQGRKISRRDAVRNMSTDLSQLVRLARIVEARFNDFRSKIQISPDARYLSQDLDEIKSYIQTGEEERKRTERFSGDFSDDPVYKIIYPGDGDVKQGIWFDYKAEYDPDHDVLRIDGRLEQVGDVRWLSDDQIEVTFSRGMKVIVSPLEPVEEYERGDEIRQGDNVICAGQYLIVVEIEPSVQLVTNYLKIINVVQEGEYIVTKTRRGRNRMESNVGMTNMWFS